jgi:hypothetical protein
VAVKILSTKTKIAPKGKFDEKFHSQQRNKLMSHTSGQFSAKRVLKIAKLV